MVLVIEGGIHAAKGMMRSYEDGEGPCGLEVYEQPGYPIVRKEEHSTSISGDREPFQDP